MNEMLAYSIHLGNDKNKTNKLKKSHPHLWVTFFNRFFIPCLCRKSRNIIFFR